MIPNASAKHYRIKAAQRDLIAAAGGIERAAQVCSYGKSTVGRWANIESPEWMPPEAVDKLEAETGLSLWTAAWVESKGLKLAGDEPGKGGSASLTNEVATLVGAFGVLLNEWSLTSTDGHASSSEADRMRRLVPQIRECLSRLEASLAAVQAAGGASLSVVEGGR